MKQTIEAIRARIESSSSIAVISHLRPDGDAYGSSLGLALSLKAAGKQTRVFNADGLLDRFTFLPGSSLIETTPESPPLYDLLISVDASNLDRIGKTFLSWNRPVHICIDHHISNPGFAEINLIVPELPSTAGLIYQMLESTGLPITPDIASNLFVGLSTDTGSFRFRGTTAQTFNMAARMVEAGADPAWLAQMCYQSISKSRFELQRKALGQIRYELGGKLAHATLQPELFEETKSNSNDTEGLVEKILEMDQTEVSILFEIKDPQKKALKASLRSKGKINVAQIASEFGGGGHPGAAGLNIEGDTSALQQQILDRTIRALS